MRLDSKNPSEEIFEPCFALSGQPVENNIFPRAALRGDRRSALPRADLLQPLRGKEARRHPIHAPAPPTSSADPWTPRWTAKDRFEPPAPHTAAIPTSRGPRPAIRGRERIQNFARLPKALNESLRKLIGIESEEDVPEKWNLSRFLERLGQEPHLTHLHAIFAMR